MIGFQRLIVQWYRLNKRDLPWRNTIDPYFIWLSEIILQQTRVAQGLSYYIKFTENFPTVFDLANASEHEVLNLWQGLGYYSRARNLHATAKKIAFELNGVFPNEYTEIKKLKGVGDYTAAAIASFSFDLPHSVVDGNVYRVLSRIFDIDLPIDSTQGKKYFAELAQENLPTDSLSIYNQAIMEFGALQCTPANPSCETCPLVEICLARINDVISERPVKTKKTKTRNRYFHYLIFKNQENVILMKREKKDIWQHLYEFPIIETQNETSFNEMNTIFEKEFGTRAIDSTEPITHILSHQKIIAQFYIFNQFPLKIESNQIVIKYDEIQNFPLSRLIDRFLSTFEF